MKRKIFSTALYVEKLKRYWALIAVGFIVFFMSMPFELLIDLDSENYSYTFVSNGLHNENFGFIVIEILLPIAAAVSIFAYLNKINSVAYMHALPFSRTSLFVSNYLAGFTLCAIPTIINALLLIALKRETFFYGTENNCYTYAAILRWLFIALVIELFTYSISVFACMVSGNGVIATLTAAGFNFLVPLLTVVVYGYICTYCIGIVDNDNIWRAIEKMHPVLLLINGPENSMIPYIISILLALAIAVASLYIYYARRLERCGDSYVFNLMQDIIGFLFVFILSSGTGLVLFEGMGISAYIIGGVLGFILGQMIARKTFRLINKKTLKNFVIFTLIMVAFFLCMRFDVFGIEKKLPDEDKVESVYVESWLLSIDDSYNTVYFDEKENIETIIDLHQRLIDNRHNTQSYEDSYIGTISITYNLDNDTVLKRCYDLIGPYEQYQDLILKLRASDEIMNPIRKIAELDGSNAVLEVYNNLLGYDAIDCSRLTTSQKNELFKALAKDYEILSSIAPDNRGGDTFYTINMEYTLEGVFKDSTEAEMYFNQFYGYNNYNSYNFEKGYVGQFRFSVSSGASNTLKWIEDNLDNNTLQILRRNNAIAYISKDGDTLYQMEKNGTDFNEKEPVYDESIVTITNAETICNILTNSTKSYIQTGGCFMSIYIKDSVSGFYEAYTTWLSLEKLPADIQAQVEKILK